MPRGPRKTNRLRIESDPITRKIRIKGRPAWTTQATKVKVNQNAKKGHVEDRRHMLHWSQVIRKLAEATFNALKKDSISTKDFYRNLTAPLIARNWKRIPSTPDRVMLMIAKRLNSTPANLVPDRADINKAIEIVRKCIDQFATYLRDSSTYEDTKDDPSLHVKRMNAIRLKAKQLFPTGNTSSLIHSRVSEINSEILKIINESQAPCQLWELLHSLRHSVTYDLSSKAMRDNTEATLDWLNRMQTAVHSAPAARLEVLVSLTDI